MNNKEHAAREWLAMIMNSWTWARLTEEEKDRFIDKIMWNSNNYLFGNYKQRWNTLSWIYSSFLDGLGYEPIGWRE